MVENGGTVASAMRKAGYSSAMIKNPQKVVRSKGFASVLESMGITHERLARVLSEGLEATKVVTLHTDDGKNITAVLPDHMVRHKYLETGIRLIQLDSSTADYDHYHRLTAEQKEMYSI